MFNAPSRKEIVPKDSDDYSSFGAPYPNYPIVSDPVDICLPGAFFNPDYTANIGMCPLYMSQRCGNKWDDKCTLYADSMTDSVRLRDFIRESASKRYCKLASNSNCTTLCQPFNPIAQQSASVCANIGNEVLRDSRDKIDIGYYLPVNISPDYTGTCAETCGVANPLDISADDPIINTCLRYGFCNDILDEICVNSTTGSFGNAGLTRYCNITVPDKTQPVGVPNLNGVVSNPTYMPSQPTQQSQPSQPFPVVKPLPSPPSKQSRLSAGQDGQDMMDTTDRSIVAGLYTTQNVIIAIAALVLLILLFSLGGSRTTRTRVSRD